MDRGLARSRALALIVPALLVVVAGVQLVRAHRLDQSSWSGGGFGMFATYENEDSRFLRVWTVGDGGEELVALPGDLERDGFEARVVPTKARLRDLAAAVAARLDIDRVRSVRVEVWGIRFGHPSATIEVFELEAAEHPLEAGA